MGYVQAQPKRGRSIRLPSDVWAWLDQRPESAALAVEILVRRAMGELADLDARVAALEAWRKRVEEDTDASN